MKMIEKASDYSYKNLSREELGESSKYINVINTDANGEKIKARTSLDEDKINEDLSLAGYNLLVTSEVNMDPYEIYKTYHNLGKIEECFRLTKSFLDGRPAYVQKRERIYGRYAYLKTIHARLQ